MDKKPEGSIIMRKHINFELSRLCEFVVVENK
jgi:hypothetical protein